VNASRVLVAIVLLLALAIPTGAFAASPRSAEVDATSHDAAPDFDLPAVSLRIVLDRALGEHAFLVIEAMRTSARPGADFEAAATVLDENTAEIEDLVSGILRPAEAEAFGEQWRNHVAYLVDYARAVVAGDEDATELAERQLETYADEFSALLTDAFPNLPGHAVHELVGEHASQLQQVTDLAEGDYEAAYLAIRDTYAHMFMIGDALTIGILGRTGDAPEGRAVALSPAVDLRLTLDRLFGEHTYLAAIVMRAHFAGDAHRDAAVQALERNSDELADRVSAIYGDAAGTAFLRLWTRHTTLYVRYVEATARGDDARQEEALRGLASYQSDFSAFLADANPLLDRAGLERLLEVHTGHLVEQVQAYADEDYDHAYHMLRDAYAQTADLSAGLAGAIADQFPQRFPDTAAPSPAPPLSLPTVIGLVCLVGALAAIAGRSSGRLVPRRRRPPGWLPSWLWVVLKRSIR
jgi:hypothetical protein